MEITQESKIGTIAAHDYRTTSVFGHYHINFCSQGSLKIHEVCVTKGISPETLIHDLKTTMNLGEGIHTNFNYWPLEVLADYVEKKHHSYFIEKVPLILNQLYIAADLFGEYYPPLIKMYKLFYESTSGLKQHMKKEEEFLFPYVRKIAASRQENKPMESIEDLSLEQTLNDFTKEHEKEMDAFSQLSDLTNDIENEILFRNLYAQLKEFEADLYLHTHLENNILFPKAVEMENTVER